MPPRGSAGAVYQRFARNARRGDPGDQLPAPHQAIAAWPAHHCSMAGLVQAAQGRAVAGLKNARLTDWCGWCGRCRRTSTDQFGIDGNAHSIKDIGYEPSSQQNCAETIAIAIAIAIAKGAARTGGSRRCPGDA